MSTVSYDPSVIAAFAMRLYAQANRIIALYTLLLGRRRVDALPSVRYVRTMTTLAILARSLRALLLGLTLSICAACASEQAERATLQVPIGSPVRALALHVASSYEAQRFGATPTVTRSLAAAGFQLAAPDARPDATVHVDVERGPARVAGGFIVIHSPDARRLRVTLEGNGYPVESVSIGFSASEPIEPAKVDALVDALVQSPRIHEFAAATAEARAAAARAEAERLLAERRAEEERQRQARAAEAAAWEAANTPACAQPTTLDACDGVRGYLAKYSEGWRSAEARELLQKAEEPLKILRDDAAWAKVDEKLCEKPKEEDACAPVDQYVEEWPEGRHAARAEELKRKAAPKLKLLRVLREARERQEAAREAAQAATAAVADDGDGGGWSGGASSGRRSRGGGPVYVRGYTRKDGTYVRPHTRRR